MNPMTNVKNIQKLNKLELERGVSSKTSWHNQYRDSAWVFIGGLPYDLSEGDILAVFSQYGEIVNVNLVRDKATGKSKGFCFLCYEDQRSTILAVDNLNSIKILGRTLRVDHCESYRKPKETGEEDDLTQQLRAHGCAPKTPSASESEGEDVIPVKKVKKEKKEKKKRKKKREKVKSTNEHEDSDNNCRDSSQPIRVKQEKIDPGYEKYDTNQNRSRGPSTDSLKIKTEPMPRNVERDSEKVRDREFRTNRNTEVDRKRNKEDEFRYSRSNASSRSRSETSTRSHNADQQNSNGDRRTERREDYRTRERDVKRESDKDRSRDQGRPRHRDHSHEPYSHGRHK